MSPLSKETPPTTTATEPKSPPPTKTKRGIDLNLHAPCILNFPQVYQNDTKTSILDEIRKQNQSKILSQQRQRKKLDDNSINNNTTIGVVDAGDDDDEDEGYARRRRKKGEGGRRRRRRRRKRRSSCFDRGGGHASNRSYGSTKEATAFTADDVVASSSMTFVSYGDASFSSISIDSKEDDKLSAWLKKIRRRRRHLLNNSDTNASAITGCAPPPPSSSKTFLLPKSHVEKGKLPSDLTNFDIKRDIDDHTRQQRDTSVTKSFTTTDQTNEERGEEAKVGDEDANFPLFKSHEQPENNTIDNSNEDECNIFDPSEHFENSTSCAVVPPEEDAVSGLDVIKDKEEVVADDNLTFIDTISEIDEEDFVENDIESCNMNYIKEENVDSRGAINDVISPDIIDTCDDETGSKSIVSPPVEVDAEVVNDGYPHSHDINPTKSHDCLSVLLHCYCEKAKKLEEVRDDESRFIVGLNSGGSSESRSVLLYFNNNKENQDAEVDNHASHIIDDLNPVRHPEPLSVLLHCFYNMSDKVSRKDNGKFELDDMESISEANDLTLEAKSIEICQSVDANDASSFKLDCEGLRVEFDDSECAVDCISCPPEEVFSSSSTLASSTTIFSDHTLSTCSSKLDSRSTLQTILLFESSDGETTGASKSEIIEEIPFSQSSSTSHSPEVEDRDNITQKSRSLMTGGWPETIYIGENTELAVVQPEERSFFAKFVIDNHLELTGGCVPPEDCSMYLSEEDEDDEDYSHYFNLLDPVEFLKGKYWFLRCTKTGEILSTVGVHPSPGASSCESGQLALSAFCVPKRFYGKGYGDLLLKTALNHISVDKQEAFGLMILK